MKNNYEWIESYRSLLASLVAAVSILKRDRNRLKKNVASDKMYDIMISDYEKDIEKARFLLTTKKWE